MLCEKARIVFVVALYLFVSFLRKFHTCHSLPKVVFAAETCLLYICNYRVLFAFCFGHSRTLDSYFWSLFRNRIGFLFEKAEMDSKSKISQSVHLCCTAHYICSEKRNTTHYSLLCCSTRQ